MDIIERAREILKNAGVNFIEGRCVNFIESRFPFTYHHDWIRSAAEPPFNFQSASRADVARWLSDKHGLIDLGTSVPYEREAIAGALCFLTRSPGFVNKLQSDSRLVSLYCWAVLGNDEATGWMED